MTRDLEPGELLVLTTGTHEHRVVQVEVVEGGRITLQEQDPGNAHRSRASAEAWAKICKREGYSPHDVQEAGRRAADRRRDYNKAQLADTT